MVSGGKRQGSGRPKKSHLVQGQMNISDAFGIPSTSSVTSGAMDLLHIALEHAGLDAVLQEAVDETVIGANIDADAVENANWMENTIPDQYTMDDDDEIDWDSVPEVFEDISDPLPFQNSVVSEYIEGIKNDLSDSSSFVSMLLKKGHLWIHPPDPRCSVLNSINTTPDPYYYPRVFVFMPEKSFRDLEIKCPRCSASANVILAGYNNNPRARRVVDITDCYYVLSRRYECSSASHGRITFASTNPDLIKSLPVHVQDSIPAIFTHRSAIDKKLALALSSLADKGTGPSPFQNFLTEMHRTKYVGCQNSYYSICVSKMAFNRNIPPKFSSFEDKLGYAGFVCGVRFLVNIFVDRIASLEPFYNKYNEQINATVLKIDHTFRIAKKMKRLNGVPMFETLFTALNEYEEIRIFILTFSTSHEFIGPSLKKIESSRIRNGYDEVEYVYTDNCCHDRPFLVKTIPSLTRDAVERPKLPILNLEGVIVMTFTSVHLANEKCCVLLQYLEELNCKEYIGLDVEWNVDCLYRKTSKIALIQLCIHMSSGYNVFLFHVASMNFVVPDNLRRIINSPLAIFVGKQIGGDLSHLKRDYPNLNAYSENRYLELGVYCRNRGFVEHGTSSLQTLCRSVLHHDIFKDIGSARISNWNSALDEEQKQYAALDAYCSLMIFKLASLIPSRSIRLLPGEANIGDSVLVMSSYGASSRPQAIGNIVRVGPITGLTRSQAIVNVEKVLVPAGKMPSSVDGKKYYCDFEGPPFQMKCPLKKLTLNVQPNSSEEEDCIGVPVVDTEKSTVVSNRVIKDAMHFMDILFRVIPNGHACKYHFSQAFRDAIFIWDKEILQKVHDRRKELNLPALKVSDNQKYFRKRCPRYIPQPETLQVRIKLVFQEYQDKMDKGVPLFSKKARETAQSLLVHSAQGCISDPIDFPLYIPVREDKHGITIYRCLRGTNDVEGAVHQKLLQNIKSWNAGIKLGGSLLGNYQYRHNIKAGARHRHDIPHVGHFAQNLFDNIQKNTILLYELPLYPWWKPLDNVKSNDESFGIMPVEIDYELPIWTGVQLTDDMKYLASRQRQTVPFLPVHTKEEMALFKKIQRESDTEIDFQKLSRVWNTLEGTDMTNIYRKLPIHLRNYLTVYERARNRDACNLDNLDQSLLHEQLEEPATPNHPIIQTKIISDKRIITTLRPAVSSIAINDINPKPPNHDTIISAPVPITPASFTSASSACYYPQPLRPTSRIYAPIRNPIRNEKSSASSERFIPYGHGRASRKCRKCDKTVPECNGGYKGASHCKG